ncbi:MAG TPA: response regulator transcription factor [Candidatus Micrarchaeaceae archaeon]|nr:response regulator transcription factor [Candidatus Baltobacterales bacterium]HVC77495.1 response regulator transcription factor [Candidatus Micrarchaeaceae archaeon]
MIRVLIVDDQALVRDGFRMILELDDQIEVVGEVEDGKAALAAVAKLRPDLVLMDIRMPGLDGLETTRRLMLQPNPPKVLVLTTYDADEYIYDAMKAGASGFLLKDVRKGQLVRAVRTVAAGDSLLDSVITRRLIERFLGRSRLRPDGEVLIRQLSNREIEVLKLIAAGLTNAEIAERLVLGESTVKTHVARILAKLELRDRVQAVVLAYESGIVLPGS